MSFIESAKVENVHEVILRIKFLKDVFPSVFLIGGFLGVLLSFVLKNGISRLWKIKERKLTPLSKWKVSSQFIWFFILSGVMIFGGRYIENSIVVKIGKNLLVISCFVYFLMGLGILDYNVKRMKFPPFMRYVLYTLSILVYPVPIIFGITEVWFKMRR